MNEENKEKNDIEVFIEDLKKLMDLREERKSLRRDIRCARRMPQRIEKLQAKLAAARATEEKEPSDANKAEVDRLETALGMHVVIDWSLLEAKSVALRTRCKEREEVLQGVFVTLIESGKINKKNAPDVLPTCRRAGLFYPGLSKRAWARKYR